MKIFNWINHEINLQRKNGLYTIYIIVNLVYIFLLGYVPNEYLDLAISFIIFSDPTILGMIFVGGFVLLEKNNGLVKGIGVMPLGASYYILGKTISLMIISILTSLFIAVFYKHLSFNILLFTLTIAISSGIFTLLGIVASAYVNSMNQYLGLIIAMSILISLPLVNFIGLNIPLLDFFPSNNILIIIYASFTSYDCSVFNLIILILWFTLLFIITEYTVENKLFKG